VSFRMSQWRRHDHVTPLDARTGRQGTGEQSVNDASPAMVSIHKHMTPCNK
jgi:hypothetical protein